MNATWSESSQNNGQQEGSQAGSPRAGERNCNDSVLSDIPDEEGNQKPDLEYRGNYNVFERYVLKVKFVHWQKDSHGLFDYHMPIINDFYHTINKPQMAIRTNSEVKFDELNTDLREQYNIFHQQMFQIHKEGNRYFIQGMEPDDKTEDVDENYVDSGEPTLPPIDMKERLYNVIKYKKTKQTNSKVVQQLKKNDIIKMGRVKVKVTEIHIPKKVRRREKKKLRHLARVNAAVTAKYQELKDQATDLKDFPFLMESLNLENLEQRNELRKLIDYPEGYEELSLGSNESNYEPLVGEKYYIDVEIPEKNKKEEPAEDKEEKEQPLSEQEEEKVELISIKSPPEPIAPPSIPFNHHVNIEEEKNYENTPKSQKAPHSVIAKKLYQQISDKNLRAHSSAGPSLIG